MTRHVTARRDEALAARVVAARPLFYAEGGDARLDRPPHVRAGSGVAWAGARLAVVQDDANFVALIDPRDGRAIAVALPAGAGGVRQFDDVRGNKADKLDLEAVVGVPGPDGAPLLVAIGSGSTPRRESPVVMRGLADLAPEPTIDVRPVPACYAALRAATAFAGSELNVEGAVFLGGPAGGVLRLFNRGNGAPHGDLGPVNATCDLNWRALLAHVDAPDSAPAPSPADVVQYELGAIGGLTLTFTDATAAATGHTVYTAAAEASPDATRDGPVAGCAIGVVAERPTGTRARWAPLLDTAGAPFGGKVEGIALDPADPRHAYVVVDRDAPDVPSALCDVVLEGAWFS